MGRSLLGLIGGGDLDEDSWEQIEDTLLIADLGPTVTSSVVAQLRTQLASRDVHTEADARAVLREVLIAELQPGLDRSVRALPHDDHPSVLLVVGVNGTGKTTTVGKLARVLVADGRRVVLGAADTFRPRLLISCRPGFSRGLPRWSVEPRVPTRPRWPSTLSTRASRWAQTWS